MYLTSKTGSLYPQTVFDVSDVLSVPNTLYNKTAKALDFVLKPDIQISEGFLNWYKTEFFTRHSVGNLMLFSLGLDEELEHTFEKFLTSDSESMKLLPTTLYCFDKVYQFYDWSRNLNSDVFGNEDYSSTMYTFDKAYTSNLSIISPRYNVYGLPWM